MSQKGQKLTKAVYEDPQVVASYIQRNAFAGHLIEEIQSFVAMLSGKKVIDLGCGPGHDTYHLAELGCDIVGLDYSSEMIEAAKKFKKIANPPRFMVADMREVGELFPENTFDGAWIAASLLHIPEEEAPQVLEGVHKIVKNGGKVYVGLKSGKQGTHMVHEENKYPRPVDREFIFWEEEHFIALVTKLGFVVKEITGETRGVTGNKATDWLNFILEVKK